jgi:inosine-uridine nucleoside N-ribohydrolase
VRPFVIDTDGGTDDCTALWWLLGEPSIDLRGILVTWGNVPRAVAAANVARVLVAAGRAEVPVVLGAEAAIAPGPLGPLEPIVHGADGLGGTADRWPTGTVAPRPEPAADWLRQAARDHEGRLELLTLGPLSTLATALALDGDLAGRVASLTVMGGAVRAIGNVLPRGEANVAYDPAAAAAVVGAAWTSPPLLMGLDVTMAALIPVTDIEAAARLDAAPARFLAAPLQAYAGFYESVRRAVDGCIPCHDLTAALAAVDPQVLTDAPIVPLAVDVGGSAAWGSTVADLRPVAEELPAGFHPWRVGLAIRPDVTADAFRALVGLQPS